jgi:hypothetical protein
MLCTIIVQMKCKSAETRQRNQTNAELMLCTIIVQMKYKSAETRRRNQTNAELMLCYVLLLYKWNVRVLKLDRGTRRMQSWCYVLLLYKWNQSLLLDITHRYKQTIIFNKKLYVIHDIYCRKRYLIFQDFLGERVHSN